MDDYCIEYYYDWINSDADAIDAARDASRSVNDYVWSVDEAFKICSIAETPAAEALCLDAISNSIESFLDALDKTIKEEEAFEKANKKLEAYEQCIEDHKLYYKD